MSEYDALIIARAEPADAATIREIALAAKIDAWFESDYLAEINRPGSVVLKVVIAGRLSGFLLARLVPGKTDDPDLDLYSIAVRPDHTLRGVGTALMEGLLANIASTAAENIWLEVRESNIGAIKFYEKHGFTKELTRRRFYSNPVESALIMRLKLRPQEKVNSA